MMFDGRMWTTLALQKGARLDLSTANADIRFEVLSTDVNSLRFLVELAKGTWVPLEQRREQSTPS